MFWKCIGNLHRLFPDNQECCLPCLFSTLLRCVQYITFGDAVSKCSRRLSLLICHSLAPRAGAISWSLWFVFECRVLGRDFGRRFCAGWDLTWEGFGLGGSHTCTVCTYNDTDTGRWAITIFLTLNPVDEMNPQQKMRLMRVQFPKDFDLHHPPIPTERRTQHRSWSCRVMSMMVTWIPAQSVLCEQSVRILYHARAMHYNTHCRLRYISVVCGWVWSGRYGNLLWHFCM